MVCVSEIAARMIKRNRPRIETSSLCNVDCTKIDHKFNLDHMIAIIFAVIQALLEGIRQTK